MAEVRVKVSADDVIGTVDRRLFGSFVEHLGRCVYDGIYEPGHSRADEHGFRTDVMDLVRVQPVRAGGRRLAAPRPAADLLDGRPPHPPADEKPGWTCG